MPKDSYTRAEILSAITLEPCHVTGDHDPTHTPFNVCSIQRSEQMQRLLVLLETDESDLPRRLHRHCGYCGTSHQVESTLNDRWRSKVQALREWQSANSTT